MITQRKSIIWMTILAITFPTFSHGQDFPTKPVTLVVPAAPGALVDIAARAIQPQLSNRLGQPVVVENRPGAANQIGTAHVAKALPDGHTLLVTLDQFISNAVASRKLPYDSFRDFTPVALILRSPYVVTASTSVKASNWREFVAHAKAMPGKLNYGSPGTSSVTYLIAEELNRRSNLDIVHVPYTKGAGLLVQALVADQVQYTVLSYSSVHSFIQGGMVRPLAIATSKRSSQLPDVPTISESGFPGFEAYNWVGILAPSGTPTAIVSRLHKELTTLLSDTQVQARLTSSEAEIAELAPEQFKDFLESEHNRWKAFVEQYQIKFEE
jgi:tripartite-type tricarboxylate transporter receptor subunit TctC